MVQSLFYVTSLALSLANCANAMISDHHSYLHIESMHFVIMMQLQPNKPGLR